MFGTIPAITGKVELVYEGEQEGPMNVAYHLMSKTIRTVFPQFFPDPEMIKRRGEDNPYASMVEWFGKNELELLNDCPQADYELMLADVPGLAGIVRKYNPGVEGKEQFLLMEFVLHGIAEFSMISKNVIEQGLTFKDLFNSVFSFDENDLDDEDYG